MANSTPAADIAGPITLTFSEQVAAPSRRISRAAPALGGAQG
jgi:hypothetical protein